MKKEHVGKRIVRVGVIGLGFAGEFHLEAYQQLRNVQVVALADLQGERLVSLGQKYNVPYLHHHYEDLLARDDLDALSVCTPNYLHAPVAIAALERGLHVLCEKPIARTEAEAQAMVQVAARMNRTLQVVFNYRSRSDVQMLKRYIEAGNLGRIYYAKASWLRRYGFPKMSSWFVNKEMAGGGCLIDLGIHLLDLVLYLVGEPKVLTVSASTYAEIGLREGDSTNGQQRSRYKVEDLATAFLRLSGGTTLLLEASWATHGSAEEDINIILYGSEGGAEIQVRNYNWQDTLHIFTNVAGVPVDIHPHLVKGEGHVAVVRQFIDAIISGNSSVQSGMEGLYRARILDACYRSAHQGCEVLVTEPS